MNCYFTLACSKQAKSKRMQRMAIQRQAEDIPRADSTRTPKSLFDVPGIKTKATTLDILAAIRESRSGSPEQLTGSNNS
jgi:hypothetical protein